MRRRRRVILLAVLAFCVPATWLAPWPDPVGRTAQAFLNYLFEPSGSAKWADLPRIRSRKGAKGNGGDDTDDIVEGARKYVPGPSLIRI